MEQACKKHGACGTSVRPGRSHIWSHHKRTPPPSTGYARALRYHLSTSLAPEEYEALNWVKAGATNIRYQVGMLACVPVACCPAVHNLRLRAWALADPIFHALSAMLMSSAHGSAHAWPPRSTSLLAVRLPTATQCTCPARQALLDGELDATLLNPPFTILVR